MVSHTQLVFFSKAAGSALHVACTHCRHARRWGPASSCPAACSCPACGPACLASHNTRLHMSEDEQVCETQVGNAAHGVQSVAQIAAQHQDDLRVREWMCCMCAAIASALPARAYRGSSSRWSVAGPPPPAGLPRSCTKPPSASRAGLRSWQCPHSRRPPCRTSSSLRIRGDQCRCCHAACHPRWGRACRR